MKTTLQILREARELIDTPEKWTKGTGNVCKKGNCADSAMCQVGNAVVRNTDEYEKASRIFCSVVGVKHLPRAQYEIWAWNDAPERTHPEVLAAFDRAIGVATALEGGK